jgi:chloride channel 7
MNMNPRHSLKIYPRVDQGYKAKKSLNFDMMRSAVFIARGDPDKAKFWRWVCYILIGFLTGIIAFLMEQLEEYMVEWRNDIVSIIIEKYATNHTIAQLLAWVFLSAWCFTIGGAASYMTIRFGPGANGSGIAELIAYLNGVNIPMLIGWDTFIIKSLCVVLGIGANLCIGKEGPLAHIGANVAVLLVYSVPLNVFQYYQNDVMKREFVAAGISAGVSAAFGSPIGGTLFAYELSKPSTFWTFSMLWRTFLCAAFATYTLSLLGHVAEKGWTDLELTAAGTLKFGSL